MNNNFQSSPSLDRSYLDTCESKNFVIPYYLGTKAKPLSLKFKIFQNRNSVYPSLPLAQYLLKQIPFSIIAKPF